MCTRDKARKKRLLGERVNQAKDEESRREGEEEEKHTRSSGGQRQQGRCRATSRRLSAPDSVASARYIPPEDERGPHVAASS